VKYLAIRRETGEIWIEENSSAVHTAVVNGYNTIAYYPILLDEDNVPTTGPRVKHEDLLQ
jgi:hypothetical protein